MQGRPIVLATLALLASGVTPAETVYKCLAGSQVIYQQTPCAKTQRQQTIQLADPAPAATRSAPPSVDPAPNGETAQAPDAAPHTMPDAPPPRLYGCIRATDGTPYTRPDGNTEPYLAPSGVVGDFGGTLGEAYSGRNAAIASAPELNRGKGSVGVLTNANYIWVQDTCRRLSVAETCRVLRDEADANRKALRNAFKSDRPPLEAKDAALARQLAGCG